MARCSCNIFWLACRIGVHHGTKTRKQYYGNMSLGFAFMPNHDNNDYFEGIVKDDPDYGAQSAADETSQGGANLESQSIDENFRHMVSSKGECLIVDIYLSLCEKCREVKDLDHARRVLLYVQNVGLEDHPVISYNLMLMFLECGSLTDAHRLFTRLAKRTELCWTVLIRGYNKNGQPQTALDLFQELQQESTNASKHAMIGALKACTELQDQEWGRVTHAKIVEEVLEMDHFVTNTLVDMYMKCNCLIDAQAIFDRLKERDLVSWNVFIGGYAEHGHSHILQQCFEQMKLDGVSPDNVTYLCIFKSCLKSCDKYKLPGPIHELHIEIVKRGFDGLSSVGNSLVHLYAQRRSFAEAHQVLNLQSAPEEIALTSLIGGYVENDNMENALNCLGLMEGFGVLPSIATYVLILKAFVSISDGLAIGRTTHAEVVERGFEMHIFVGNSLVDMYCKCGSLLDAQYVFNKLSTPDVFSWTALLFGYVEHGLPEEALRCLRRMGAEGVAPNAISYICGLKACQSAEDLLRGQELHSDIVKREFEADLVLGNTLVDFYANSGLLLEAKEVFDQLPIRNVVLWNTFISGHAEKGNVDMILHLLKQMEVEGIIPTSTTFLCALKACGSPCSLFLAQKIHSCAAKKGLECSLSFKNSLVDVYLKCNMIFEANNVFYNSGERDIVSWNSFMGRYADAGLFGEVFDCLTRMGKEGAAPNGPTFLAILKSCKFLDLVDRGRLVHSLVIKVGFETGPYVASALVDMYAKHGYSEDAGSVLNKQQIPSIVAWTALIVGYMEHGFGEKALETYELMRKQGVPPDESLYVCVLKACGNMGAMDKGLELYGEVIMSGIQEENNSQRITKSFTNQTIDKGRSDLIALNLHNVLVDMLCRCGSLVDAQKVFDSMLTSDCVTWNALMAGYALQGKLDSLLPIFDKMKKRGVWPDAVTYTSVLTVCSHVGSIECGQIFVQEMSKVYGLLPIRQHFNCIVDLLSRAGQLNAVLEVVETIPFQPDVVTWLTVLGGCCRPATTDIRRHAFNCSVSLVENGLPGFVSVSNIYADTQLCEDVMEIEMMRVRLRTGIG